MLGVAMAAMLEKTSMGAYHDCQDECVEDHQASQQECQESQAQEKPWRTTGSKKGGEEAQCLGSGCPRLGGDQAGAELFRGNRGNGNRRLLDQPWWKDARGDPFVGYSARNGGEKGPIPVQEDCSRAVYTCLKPR